MQLTPNELKSILDETERELTSLLKSEQERLAKAIPGQQTESEASGSSPSSSTSPVAPEASSASASSPSASASGSEGSSASGSAPPMAGPPADASGAPAPGGPGPDMGAPGPDAGGGGELDPQAVQAELEKLPIEELKVYFLAAKAAIMSKMGGDGGPDAGGPPPGPDAGAPAPGPDMGAPGPGAPPAMKAEHSASMSKDSMSAFSGSASASKACKNEMTGFNSPERKGIEGKPACIEHGKKSEEELEVENLKKTINDQNELLAQLVGAVTKIVERPERKAITGMSFVPKTEDSAPVKLNKTEIVAKLSDVAANPSLKKTDRELITAYCVGTISVDKIEHLLK